MFQARTFPYDEARKLALGVGYDIDTAANDQIVKKKSGNVNIIPPADRAGLLRRRITANNRFGTNIDAVHHLLNTYQQDGLAAARQWHSDSGYGTETSFRDTIQAAINAVPRTRTTKGEFGLPEAQLLEDTIVALFESELALPAEQAPESEPQQGQLDLV